MAGRGTTQGDGRSLRHRKTDRKGSLVGRRAIGGQGNWHDMRVEGNIAANMRLAYP